MRSFRPASFALLVLLAAAACKKDAPSTSAAAPAPARPSAPTPPPVRVDQPVNPPQTVPGGVAVTGPFRMADGVAGAIETSGTQVTAQTPLAVGNIVQVIRNGVYYQGQVLALNPDGSVHLHFVGWSSNWDTDATRDKLRVGPIAPLSANTGAAPAAPAAAPAATP